MSRLPRALARSWALWLLVLQACAFPPACEPLTPDDFPDGGAIDIGATDCSSVQCAGRCSEGRCVAAFEGDPCDPSGVGTACETGTSCQDGVCTKDGACTSEACLCAALTCAGRCAQGACVAVGLGETCNPDGAGPACLEGSCVEDRCQAGTGSVAPVAQADFLSTERQLYCDWLVRCDYWPKSLAARCGESLFPSTPLFDSDSESLAAVGRGDATYSDAEAGACLRPFANLGCTQAYPAACERVFTGKLAQGAACTATQTCVPDQFCQRTDITGLVCQGACAPRAKVGEDCSEKPCVAGLACVSEGGQGSALQRCRAKSPAAGLGQQCGTASPGCQSGLYCRASDHTCQALRHANETCDDAFGCVSPTVCALLDGGTRAMCLPRRQRGESCQSNQQCAPLTLSVAAEFCDHGTCAPLPKSGACVQDTFLRQTCDPEASFCGADGQCHALRQPGDVCQSASECGGTLGPQICSFGACREPNACE